MGQEIALDTLKDAISGVLHSLILLMHSNVLAAASQNIPAGLTLQHPPDHSAIVQFRVTSA